MNRWILILFLCSTSLGDSCSRQVRKLVRVLNVSEFPVSVTKKLYPQTKLYLESRDRIPVIEMHVMHPFDCNKVVQAVIESRTKGRWQPATSEPAEQLLELRNRFPFHIAIISDAETEESLAQMIQLVMPLKDRFGLKILLLHATSGN